MSTWQNWSIFKPHVVLSSLRVESTFDLKLSKFFSDQARWWGIRKRNCVGTFGTCKRKSIKRWVREYLNDGVADLDDWDTHGLALSLLSQPNNGWQSSSFIKGYHLKAIHVNRSTDDKRSAHAATKKKKPSTSIDSVRNFDTICTPPELTSSSWQNRKHETVSDIYNSNNFFLI